MKDKLCSWQQNTFLLVLSLIRLFVAFFSSLLALICMQQVPFTAVLERAAAASKTCFSFFFVCVFQK